MCETDDIDFEDDVSWDNSPTFNVSCSCYLFITSNFNKDILLGSEGK